MCCSFGMKLATIETKEKLDCMALNNISKFLFMLIKSINDGEEILFLWHLYSFLRVELNLYYFVRLYGIIVYNRVIFSAAIPAVFINNYLIAASRMGALSKPVWCFTNRTVNMSWFTNDKVTGNLDGSLYSMAVAFYPDKNTTIMPFLKYTTAICESL